MEKQIEKILDQYDIPEKIPVVFIHESSDNIVYSIGEKDKKILRIGKKTIIDDIKFEFEAMEYLSKNGFPVSAWIKTKNGNFYASIEDIEVAVVFDFLEGYHIQLDKEHLPSKERAYIAGRALGSMSEIGKTFKPTCSRRRNIFSELERIIENEKTFKKDFEGGETFVEEVKQTIKFGKKNKLPIGLIHNDYRSGNVFFKRNNEICGVIDFDWSCIGPLIKDLALGVLEWSCPDGRTEPDFSIFDIFLEGYNSVSTQKYSRNKELYSWIMFAALSDTATFFCDRLNNSEQKKNINYSYMYHKYLFFSNL